MNRFIRIRLSPGLATALLLALAPATARAQDFINILTGGTSGVYYPMGVALSKIYGEKIPNVPARPCRPRRPRSKTCSLLQQGKRRDRLHAGRLARRRLEGRRDAGFKTPLKKLRGITAIYPNYIQIVAAKDSGIKTLADLKGKRLSVGAPKSGTELNARAILAAAGMSYKDLGKIEYLPFAESVELMKNRQLDATLQSAGLGVASMRDLAASVEIVVVEVPKAATVDKAGPPFVKRSIPANTYGGQTADVNTAAGRQLPRHP
jgi:TRAP transporter TAXI family solute receptor